jgi:hypothetical protein
MAITPAQAGGLNQGSEPSNVAFCVAMRTAASGRTARGRKFFAGLGVETVTGNTLNQTTIDGFIQFLQNINIALDNINMVLAIVSRILNGVERAVPLARAVTGFSAVDPYVDSQRRRAQGRGA